MFIFIRNDKATPLLNLNTVTKIYKAEDEVEDDKGNEKKGYAVVFKTTDGDRTYEYYNSERERQLRIEKIKDLLVRKSTED